MRFAAPGTAVSRAGHAAAADLGAVRGLDEYWDMHVAGSPRGDRRHERILLDALGLGLEQTLRHLAEQRPDLAGFRGWIVETAGLPDPMAIARYHAVLDRAPAPQAIAERLAAVEAAPDVLDADDLAGWARDGFVVLRQAIPADAARAAEDLLWRTMEARPDDAESWYRVRPQGIMVQLFQHPALEPARRSQRIHKAFAQLWGVPDLWMTTDRMSFNPPERRDRPFQGPFLHWDVSLARPIPFATQGILYLTDTSADQGALRVVPGFHHRIDAWLDGLGDSDPRTVDLDAEAVPIAAGAGDLVIWRQDLPHGASPNRAARPRMAQYINMYPADLQRHAVWR